jgi:hypothetical protein
MLKENKEAKIINLPILAAQSNVCFAQINCNFENKIISKKKERKEEK